MSNSYSHCVIVIIDGWGDTPSWSSPTMKGWQGALALSTPSPRCLSTRKLPSSDFLRWAMTSSQVARWGATSPLNQSWRTSSRGPGRNGKLGEWAWTLRPRTVRLYWYWERTDQERHGCSWQLTNASSHRVRVFINDVETVWDHVSLIAGCTLDEILEPVPLRAGGRTGSKERNPMAMAMNMKVDLSSIYLLWTGCNGWKLMVWANFCYACFLHQKPDSQSLEQTPTLPPFQTFNRRQCKRRWALAIINTPAILPNIPIRLVSGPVGQDPPAVDSRQQEPTVNSQYRSEMHVNQGVHISALAEPFSLESYCCTSSLWCTPWGFLARLLAQLMLVLISNCLAWVETPPIQCHHEDTITQSMTNIIGCYGLENHVTWSLLLWEGVLRLLLTETRVGEKALKTESINISYKLMTEYYDWENNGKHYKGICKIDGFHQLRSVSSQPSFEHHGGPK